MRKFLLSALAVVLGVVAAIVLPAPPDQHLQVGPPVLARLAALRPALTFGPDPKTGYTGIHDPYERQQSDAAFAQLIDGLIVSLPQHPRKRFVLDEMIGALGPLSGADTEDRERALGYCERIMAVLGIQSSDGRLNRWMYGPILGRLVGNHD